MSQSLYTAMGGINAATTEIQVVSNNVANINTTAFKASSVNFEDVYSTTISSGSVATSSTGGTNPIQVGVGTKVSSISKDFNAGSSVATGNSTDLMIKGSGFFTVTDGNSTFYTRAGNFSFDSNGNLVTSNGYQVEGTDSIMSSATSGKTVSIPLTICADVEGTKAATLGSEKLTSLNGLGTKTNITSGDFSMSLTIGGVVYTGTVSALSGLTTDSTVTDVVNYLNGPGGLNFTSTTSPAATTTTASHTVVAGDAYATAGATAGDVVSIATTTAAGATLSGLKANVIDGKIQIDASNVVVHQTQSKVVTDTTDTTKDLSSMNTTGVPITSTGTAATAIAYSTTGLTKATNFVTATGLSSAAIKSGITETNTLDSTASISQLSTATNSISKTGITINADGSIQVTYNDGSVLAVQLDADSSKYSFVYTTADHVQISGTKCAVDANVATPANFVAQMANVTNVDGLLSVGSNLFETGPNSGDVVYTTAGEMGAGQVESGYLEASNVDLSKELSNMILAQRAIQANSRVFTTTSNIMDVITQMGR